MKSSIIDQLELDEDTQAAARREAMRRKVPVNLVLKEWVMAAARAINANAEGKAAA
jgi:hypothetical protein